MPGVAMREQAAMCVDGKCATELNSTILDKAPALALGTEAQVFQFDNHDWREAIVQFRKVDIRRAKARHRVGALPRFLGGRNGQAYRLAYVLVPVSLDGTEQIDGPLSEIARSLGRGHDDSGPTVAYQGTVQEMQRIAHHARIQN